MSSNGSSALSGFPDVEAAGASRETGLAASRPQGLPANFQVFHGACEEPLLTAQICCFGRGSSVPLGWAECSEGEKRVAARQLPSGGGRVLGATLPNRSGTSSRSWQRDAEIEFGSEEQALREETSVLFQEGDL